MSSQELETFSTTQTWISFSFSLLSLASSFHWGKLSLLPPSMPHKQNNNIYKRWNSHNTGRVINLLLFLLTQIQWEEVLGLRFNALLSVCESPLTDVWDLHINDQSVLWVWLLIAAVEPIFILIPLAVVKQNRRKGQLCPPFPRIKSWFPQPSYIKTSYI